MAGLVGIPLGIAAVEYGPLNSFYLSMKQQVVSNSVGGAVTLSSITGLSFWLITLIIAALTLVSVFFKRKKSIGKNSLTIEKKKGFLLKPWQPWQAGIAIGLLVIPAYLSSAATGRNYPLGVTHGVLHTQMLITESNLHHIYEKPDDSGTNKNPENLRLINSTQQKGRKVSWWLILLVTSLIVGSWTSARLQGKVKLLPKPPEQTVVAFFGGILVGVGAAFATGCVIGNIISGWALMSLGLFIFGIVTIITNWLTTYFYLMGGKIKYNSK